MKTNFFTRLGLPVMLAFMAFTVNVNAQDACTEPVGGNDFNWNYLPGMPIPGNPIVDSFDQPGTDAGFTLDIWQLDNSFQMNINGSPIATEEIQFQDPPPASFSQNIRFKSDGGRWGYAGIPQIWTMVGNADADPTNWQPILRISISETGNVTMYGLRVNPAATPGPYVLEELELFNGNSFNTVSWNQDSTNHIEVSQKHIYRTTFMGTGYGNKYVECPFECGGQVYMSHGNSKTALFEVDTTNDPFVLTPIGVPSDYRYNALALNPIDNNLYAMDTKSGNLLRIHPATGVVDDLGSIGVSGDFINGDFDTDGNYYIGEYGSTSTIFKVDVTTNTATPISLSNSVTIYDFAYNYETGLLYGVDAYARLVTINPITGEVTRTGAYLARSFYGSVFWEDLNTLIAYREKTGEFISIPIDNPTAITVVATNSKYQNNDAAQCKDQLDGKKGPNLVLTNEELSLEVSAFPNPVTDMLQLNSNLEIQQVSVFSKEGHQVLNASSLVNGSINMAGLPSGLYMINVVAVDGQSKTIKVMKR